MEARQAYFSTTTHNTCKNNLCTASNGNANKHAAFEHISIISDRKRHCKNSEISMHKYHTSTFFRTISTSRPVRSICCRHANMTSCHSSPEVTFPLPSTRQHLSNADSLENKRDYYQNCSVLLHTTVVHNDTRTHMSSS